MISFNRVNDFVLGNESNVALWLEKVISEENKREGEINYIFCDDVYLHKLNVDFLNHDTLTDIISFDYSTGNMVAGDIYISVERVRENARDFKVSFDDELSRVMVHGLLHYCGYDDKTPKEIEEMRSIENYYLGRR